MQLYIDTSKLNSIKIILTKNGKISKIERTVKNHRNQLVLPIIESLLRKNKLKINDIDSVIANPGPGSFTGIRVGIAIAHAIRFALGLKEKPIKQVYS